MQLKALLLHITVLSLFSNQVNAIELQVAYENKEQYPYYLGNTMNVPQGRPGVAVEMIKLLEENIPDLQVKFIRCPWSRCLKLLARGSVAGVFNASFKKERLTIGAYPWKNGTIDPSRKITDISYFFYKLQGSNFRWDGAKTSFSNGDIGAPRGYSIVGDLRKMGLKVQESNWTKNDFLKLKLNRVSVVAAQGVTGDSLLQLYPQKFSNIVKVVPPISVKPYYLMLSIPFVTKHPHLSEIIWNTIASIRENQLSKISLKYSQ